MKPEMNEFYIFEDIEYHEKIPVKHFIAAIEESWGHWHKEIEVLFVLSGTLQITVEESRYDLNSGDIILINSNRIHSIKSEGNLTFVLQFVPELIYQIYGKDQTYYFNLNTSASKLNKETADKLKSVLARIGIEYSRMREGYKFFLWSYFYEFVGCLFRYCDYKAQTSDPRMSEDLKKVTAIINHINKHFKEDLSLETIAEAVNMNVVTQSKFFRKKTGMSILFYLKMVRINHAKQLLESFDTPVIEVAQECGFYSLPTFYRAFNEIVGISPKEYKKTRKSHAFKDHIQLVQGYLIVDSVNEYALLHKYL
jgi:xylan 1,4-beta-xylosidase